MRERTALYRAYDKRTDKWPAPEAHRVGLGRAGTPDSGGCGKARALSLARQSASVIRNRPETTGT